MLQGVVDRDANKLALRLMKLLTLSWHFCKKYKAAGLTQMPGAIQLRIEKIYDQILQRALTKEAAYMEKQRQVLGRKKVRNTKAYNLFKRLIEFKVETLRFMSDFSGSVSMLVAGLMGYLNAWVILVPATLYFLGSGLLFPTATTAALEPFPENAGVAGAVLGGMQNLGGGLVTLVAASVPMSSQVPVAAILCVLTLLVVMTARLLLAPATGRAAV